MRALWVAVAVALWGAPAGAETDPQAIPSGIRVEVRGAVASIRASFTMRVGPKEPQYVSLGLPFESVVIGATVRDATAKRPLKLVRAEDARAAFDKLLYGRSGRAPGTIVELFESDGPRVGVLSPVATTLTFDLQYEAPTCILNEQRYVLLPEEWREHISPALQRRVEDDVDELPDCGNDRTPSVFLRFAAPIARKGVPIAATAARFADSRTQAARVEVAVATKLSVVPDDLHTVFVIDASRSMTSAQRRTARALVSSYLAHASRSSVQVVTFSRTASALLPAWSSASAAATIDKGLVATRLKNGSEVQAGLREAGRWLARAKGTRRVVLISDELVADRVGAIPTDELAKEVPAGTLVHVVGVGERGELARNDNARWAALAAKTEGIGAYAGVDDDGRVDALELVRPIAVDHVSIASAGWEQLEGGCVDERLGQGRACTWWGSTTEPGDSIAVEGFVWNKRWTQTLALGDEGNVAIARQLRFVMNVDAALAAFALDAAMALSESWSFVARWGGEDGYGVEQPGGGGTGWGTTCGGCGYGTIGHGSGTATYETSPLKYQLYDAVHWCLRDDVTLALRVETTFDEIVDVTAKVTLKSGTGAPADAAQIESCVTDGVWETTIDLEPSRAHLVHTLTY